MSKSFFERFVVWQNYLHYFLLAVGVSVVAYYFEAPFDLWMFLVLFVSLFVIDTLVHGFFWFAPKKIRWRD